MSSVRDIPWRLSSQGFSEGQSPGHLVPAPPVSQNPNKNKAEVVQHKLCLQSSFGMSLFYNLGNDGNPSKVCGPRQQTRANLEYSQSYLLTLVLHEAQIIVTGEKAWMRGQCGRR